MFGVLIHCLIEIAVEQWQNGKKNIENIIKFTYDNFGNYFIGTNREEPMSPN